MYTEKFKKRVLSAYPDSPEIERLLLEGSWALGAKLKQFSHIEIKPQDILACRTIQEAHKLAETIAIRTQIYEDWLSVGNAQHTSVPCREQVQMLFGDDGISYPAPQEQQQQNQLPEIKPWVQHMQGEPFGYT